MPNVTEAAAPPAWTPKAVVLFAVTVAGAIGCLMLARSFAPALIWSVAIAVATRSYYLWLARLLRKPAAAALLAVATVLLVIILPVLLLSYSLGVQLVSIVNLFRSGAAQDWANGMLSTYPHMNRIFQHIQGMVSLKNASQSAAGWLGVKLQSILAGSVQTLTQAAIMLFALFFFYKDGEKARRALASAVPASVADADDVLRRMSETISAALRGSLTIAAIQASLGGLMFWILAVPQTLLWAFVMGLFALVPSLGTFLIWMPVAVYLALSGHAVKAVVLFVWGATVIGSVDNLLYPKLVGNKLKLHTLAIFFAVLGGISVFGLSGLVLGPLLLTTTLALLHLWSPNILPLESK